MFHQTVPWPFRLADRIVESARLARRSGCDLAPESVKRTACASTGLHEFGDPWFQDGLQVLTASLESDAGLSALGRVGLRGMLVTLLSNRLLMQAERNSHPDRFRRTMPPPLVILGLPRSGTTFLHRVMSLDPMNRSLPMWRLQRPFPPRRGPDRRRRQTARVLSWFRRLAPDLDVKHHVRPDSAEECIWLLNSTFVSHALWISAPVTSYLDWLLTCDREPAYHEYASMLRYIQGEEPGRRLLLKAPSHAGSLRELRAALPQVMVVQTHRDPVEVLPSLNSLICTTQMIPVRRLDVARTARANLAMLIREMELNRQARDAASSSLFDLPYPELCEDPVGTVRRIYRHFSLGWPPGLESTLRKQVENHPRDRFGPHTYSNRDFGFEDEEVAKVFSAYRQAWGFAPV